MIFRKKQLIIGTFCIIGISLSLSFLLKDLCSTEKKKEVKVYKHGQSKVVIGTNVDRASADQEIVPKIASYEWCGDGPTAKWWDPGKSFTFNGVLEITDESTGEHFIEVKGAFSYMRGGEDVSVKEVQFKKVYFDPSAIKKFEVCNSFETEQTDDWEEGKKKDVGGYVQPPGCKWHPAGDVEITLQAFPYEGYECAGSCVHVIYSLTANINEPFFFKIKYSE
ncbi:MAG: hypothetical protein RAO92_01030 [Candidatus Euphemobacter frigidus]|nr:hypothetical protein [Candidatus Euphemobacter frigidus]MDP8274962.1 hypothetical protein [Candidatus Euphemobacter frigidus]